MAADPRVLRLLLVEDEALVLEDLRDIVEDLGHQVVGAAADGPTALRLAESTRPDLALLDIHIQGPLDGIEVGKQLRRTLGVPSVFVTANADVATVESATGAEPFGYVVKPFSESDIRAAVAVAIYRHRAEEMVRQMEAWLSTTLRSIGDAVIATDEVGRISFLNATAELLTGWTRTEAVGRQLGEVFTIQTPQGEPAQVEAIISTVMRSGVVFHIARDHLLRARTGRLIPIDDSVAPIRGADEVPEGVVVVFRDRTELVRAEAARREFEQRAQEAQRLESLGLLAGGVAHDFNNLLAVIMGHASAEAEQASDPAERAETMDIIVQAAQRGAGLCAQLLAYAGKGSPARTPIGLGAFASETARLLAGGIPSSVRVVLDLDPQAGSVTGDPSQLQQVVRNLVANAVDALAGAPGTITLRTRVETLDRVQLAQARLGADLAPGRYVLLEVSDSGPGMEPAVLARIFEPFFTTKRLGRGLGLSAVLGIVRSHGAGILVDSTPGAGTRVRLFFEPRQPAPAETRAPAKASAWRGHGRILIVDDEEPVARVAALVLSRLGFETEIARDGAEGWARFQAAPQAYGLVLTDMTMPRMSGLDASLLMRGLRPDIPIVLMSGYAVDTEEARAQGFVARLDKPFSAGTLREAVRSALR